MDPRFKQNHLRRLNQRHLKATKHVKINSTSQELILTPLEIESNIHLMCLMSL